MNEPIILFPKMTWKTALLKTLGKPMQPPFTS